ncbi:hypothetical protein [Afifella pfennigii]|uniref:hypothetical protein n=1 Tax=Afifella pfennigii TaxID=209897 RepID=UPI0012EBDB9B|nr:hypothetical protein [Afifella pfennigii]
MPIMSAPAPGGHHVAATQTNVRGCFFRAPQERGRPKATADTRPKGFDAKAPGDAAANGWTVVDMAKDWKIVWPDGNYWKFKIHEY